MAGQERAEALLGEAKIMVLATVGPDGRPHAVPLWFVWHEGRMYFGTDADSVKVRNLAECPEVAAVVERGGEEGASHAAIVRGPAARIPAADVPAAALQAFRAKYAWDPSDASALFVVTPRHVRAW